MVRNGKLVAVEDSYLVSGYIREQNELYERIPIFNNSDQLERVKDLAPRRIPDKAAKLLKIVEHKTKHFGDSVRLMGKDYPIGYCLNRKEFIALLRYCRGRGWLSGTDPCAVQLTTDFNVRLEADGFAELEARAKANVESDGAFVAMRFSEEMKAVYEAAIEPAIKECGFRPVRIDQNDKIGDVVDLMLAEIRASRFVVADFTERNEGVYFETGFAMGLSLPVISTCRKDWMEGVHFDTNHFSHIVWWEAEELKKGLVARIRANIGFGPLPRKE